MAALFPPSLLLKVIGVYQVFMVRLLQGVSAASCAFFLLSFFFFHFHSLSGRQSSTFLLHIHESGRLVCCCAYVTAQEGLEWLMFCACWRPRQPPLPVTSGVQEKNNNVKMFQTAALFSAQLSQGGTVSEDSNRVSEDSNRVITRVKKQEFCMHNFYLSILILA